MNSDSPSSNGEMWCRDAMQLAIRLNTHYWLSTLIPRLSVALVVLGVLALALRESGVEGYAVFVLDIIGLFGVSFWSVYTARKHFRTGKEGLERGLVRLETVLNLHSGLSAAYLGGLPWPSYESVEESQRALLRNGGYDLNFREILGKPTLALVFFLVAGIIPVHPAHAYTTPLATQLPPDLAQVQTWLDKLKQENLIDPEKLKEAEDQLDQFKNRSPKQWYTQENLEGANALKDSTAQAMQNLQEGLDKADQALQDGMDKTSDPAGNQSLSKKDSQALQDDLKKADDKLTSGNLPMKQELAKQLTGAESAQDTPMTHEQMEKMQKKLQAAKNAANGEGKDGKGGKDSSSSKLSDEMKNAMKNGELGRSMQPGNGPGEGMGKGHGKGERGGPGGKGGGESTAPLELEQRELFANGTQVNVKTNDPSNSVPGELVNVSAEAPKVDPTEQTGPAGGSATTQGNGGEAVWRSDYDPQEADVLRNYFKSNDK